MLAGFDHSAPARNSSVETCRSMKERVFGSGANLTAYVMHQQFSQFRCYQKNAFRCKILLYSITNLLYIHFPPNYL